MAHRVRPFRQFAKPGKRADDPFVGQRRIKDSDGFFLLTSFNRTVGDRGRFEAPGFAKIPLVGKALRKSTASTQNRSFMLLARAVQQRPGDRLAVPNVP